MLRKSIVNKALHKPRLSYGVSTKVVGMCWGGGIFMAVILTGVVGFLAGLGAIFMAFIIHTIFRYFFRKNHRCIDIYTQYAKLAPRYHPHKREKLRPPFERPARVGRGIRF